VQDPLLMEARILIVGPSNTVLEAFFDNQATRAVANVTHLGPDALTKESAYRGPARNGDYDLVIFDRCAPASEEDMPRGNTFFIGQPPPPYKRTAGDAISNPQIKGWISKHPVMRRLAALQDVGILEAFKVKNLPPRTPKLIEIDQNNTLLFTLSRGSFTDLVMTFPIIDEKDGFNTNWPTWRDTRSIPINWTKR